MSLSESFIPIIMFLVIAYIVKIALNYRTRKRLIEKGLLDENIKNLFGDSIDSYGASTLKWGLVLFLVGLVVLVLEALPYYIPGEVTFGAMLVAAGTGLLLFYAFHSRPAAGRASRHSEGHSRNSIQSGDSQY